MRHFHITYSDVTDESLQMFVVVKHCTETWSLSARLFFKLAIDNWPRKKEENILQHVHSSPKETQLF